MSSQQKFIKYPYVATRVKPYHLPYISVWLSGTGKPMGPFNFLVDTGTIFSYAPISWALDVVNLPKNKVDTGCESLSGICLEGYPAEVNIILNHQKDNSISVKETIYFKDDVTYGVLGHESFLRHIPAFFWTAKDKGWLTLHVDK